MGYSPAQGHVTLAQLREAAGDHVEAERHLQIALSSDPQNGAALYQLGQIHARLGRSAEAANEIARAIELMPQVPADAYVELAELYDAQGEPGPSEAVLKQMEALPGGREAAGLALARIKVRHGARIRPHQRCT